MTAQTNFLLIHRRAEEDKSNDMPELHTISQMVPAGWGGVGSVNYLHAVPPVCNPCFDMAQSSIPPVFRRSSSKSDSSDVDIPDFLRNVDHGVDRTKPHYWVNSADYTGLTPLGLSEWLNKVPKNTWPTTYQELQSIVVGVVVEWLELVIAPAVALPEAVLIGAFLSVMANPDTHRSLIQGLGEIGRAKGIARWAKGLFARRAVDGGASVNSSIE